MNGWNQSLGKFVACAILALGLASCSGCGSDGGGTTTPPAPPAGTVTLTGTVSGTIIWVLNATNAVIGQFDTATLNQPPNFPFNVGNVPTGVPLRMFFVTGGAVYPLYFGNTNVFTFTSGGTVDLGLVATDTASGRATPATVPTNVTPGSENTNIPQIVVPPTASISVTNPINQAQVQGPDVPISFALQNFTIGNQNQAHLHVYLDGDQVPYEFLNGAPVLHNGVPAPNAQWVSATQIRFVGLSTNSNHTVQFNLATASHTEFVAPGMDTVQFFVLPPPANPATIDVTSPMDNQPLPFGPVTVAFNATNLTIQGPGQSQLHFYMDGNAGNLYQFLNNPNQVLLNGTLATDVEWVSSSSFRFTSLTAGQHSIRLVLANSNGANTELTNSQATDIVPFTVNAAPVASVTVISGASFLSSPVTIIFSVTDFTIGLPGTPHLRFSIDSGPLHDFYNGVGINSDNGVLLNGVHDHAVHWRLPHCFDLFGLAAGAHQVRLVLVDASDTELTTAGASKTHNFTVQQPPTGELKLQPVLNGLSFPVGLSLAPDGRMFYSERLTGAIRIIHPGWQLDPNACVQIPVAVSGEQGLLGLTLDPNFSSNHYVYVYYTAPGATMNRVARYTELSGVCTNETTILDNLPVSNAHNGGIIQFGPDVMLYVVIGDANVQLNAQVKTSLAGKILRVNPANGAGLLDNPFFGSGNVNQDRVFSYGHRNSYGFTFHPQTNHLWESENGPDDNDEINRVVAGGNYGWPTWRGIVNQAGFVDPILAFNPVIAPTGIIAIPGNSSIYPPVYRNNLLVAVWNDGTIRHVILSGANLDQLGGSSTAYTGGQGGLLSLMLGSDGYVYVSNGIFNPSNGSSIFRVVPH